LNDLALIPPDINRAASPMGQQIIEDRWEKTKKKIKFIESVTESIQQGM
jgi:hypothetical protein